MTIRDTDIGHKLVIIVTIFDAGKRLNRTNIFKSIKIMLISKHLKNDSKKSSLGLFDIEI